MKQKKYIYGLFFISIAGASLNPFSTRRKSVYSINSLGELKNAITPLRDRQGQDAKPIDPLTINPRVLAEHFVSRSGHTSSSEVLKKAEDYLRSERKKAPMNYAAMVSGVLNHYQHETMRGHGLRFPMITRAAIDGVTSTADLEVSPTPAPTPSNPTNMFADLEVGLQQGLSSAQAGKLDTQFLNNVSEGVIKKFNDQLTSRQRMLIIAVALNIVQFASFLPAVTTGK